LNAGGGKAFGMSGFWRWYDRAARADFAGTLLGYVFDWKGWITGTLGSVVTFSWAAIDGRSPLDVWVLTVVVMAALTVGVNFLIPIIEKIKGPRTDHAFLTNVSTRSVKIFIGVGSPFEIVQPSGVNRTRAVSVKIENNTDDEISDARLEIVSLDPPANGHEKLLLKGEIKLSPRKHLFIPVADYNEGTSQARVGTWIRLAIPIAPAYGGGPGNLPVKPHTFHLKFSSSEYGLFDEVACLLFVDSNHILHLKDRAVSTKLNDVSPLARFGTPN